MHLNRSSLLAVLVFAWLSSAHGHILGKSFVVYEVTDEHLDQVDLYDGTVGEWEALMGPPSLRARPDWVHPANFYDTGAIVTPYSVSDGDWRVWLAWHRSTSRIYVAMERRDDAYVDSEGEDISDASKGDAISFMIDGDHSGGEYSFHPHLTSDVCCESDEEYRLANESQAQLYWAVADPPGVGSIAAGGEWINKSPFSEAGGAVMGNTTTLEFYVTAFDSLVWDSPDRSVRSTFSEGVVIGFELEVWDYDEPGESPLVLQLGKQANTWRFAERFVDGVLHASNPASVVVDSTWGEIKKRRRVSAPPSTAP